jgi:hypothetical protein
VIGQAGGHLVRGSNLANRVVLTRDARPGQVFQIAVFAANGPLSEPPANHVWVPEGHLIFEIFEATGYSPIVSEAMQAVRKSGVLELVRGRGPRLFAVARRYLRSEHDAQDAVQDAFVSALRSLERFEGASRISTWLHRIVIDAALSKLRERRRHPEVAIEDLLPRSKDDGHQVEPCVRWKDARASDFERRETFALACAA